MSTFMNFEGDDRVACLSASAGGAKRTSRTTHRINTAERRATHNAVQRQRRKTLNERFLVSFVTTSISAQLADDGFDN
jgi:hypothetical protein